MQAPQLSRRERKKRENRQRIVQAAIDLFQAQGFDHTPIEAITEKADVSRGTFFNHFASKESVLAEIAALEMEHLEQLVDTELSALPSAVAQIRHLMRALVEDTRPYMHVTRYVLLETMMHHPGEEASTARLSGILIALVEHGQHQGEIRAGLAPAEVAYAIASAYLSAFLGWMDTQADTSPVVGNVVDMLFEGIAGPAYQRARAKGEKE